LFVSEHRFYIEFDTMIVVHPARKRLMMRQKHLIQRTKGWGGMEIVMVITGLIGMGLLVYLFYVLFRGETL